MKRYSIIESLESRIAPASVTINAAAKVATWTDWDGDAVTLKWSTNEPAQFFTSDAGAGLIMDGIQLSASANSNEAFKLTVKPGPVGDGRIDLGYINAIGVPLKSWSSPAATVAEIQCGDGTTGIDTLHVGSLGTLRTSSFASVQANGFSLIKGHVSSLTIHGDIGGTELGILDGGAIKNIDITGSLRGLDATDSISGAGRLLVVADSIGKLTVGGSVLGGDSEGDGSILAKGSVGKLTVKGSILGGTGPSTGRVTANAHLAVIGGSVIGGDGPSSGQLAIGDATSLSIGGSIVGGKARGSGFVDTGSVGIIAIKGGIFGGIETEATSNGRIGTLNSYGSVKTLTVGGDLVAGSYGSGERAAYNGAIIIQGTLGMATIRGGIYGNPDQEAFILADSTSPAAPGNFQGIGKLNVLGSVAYGYIAAGHGTDFTNYADRIGTAENPDAGIGSVKVGGDWFHSNLTAGINDNLTSGFSTNDTHSAGDPARQAILGPVVIGGRILDNPLLPGSSGFGAEKIASIIAGGAKLFKTGDAARSLDTFGYVDVAEIA